MRESKGNWEDQSNTKRRCCFVRSETFKVNTYSLGKNKTNTSSNRSNMSHQVETKMI
jgi:hypothetical protein